jgi:spermidine/putrescine-binding protein
MTDHTRQTSAATRRKILKGASAAGLAGLAGCTSGGNGGGGNGGGGNGGGGNGGGGNGGGGNGGGDTPTRPIEAESIPPATFENQANVWNWYESWVQASKETIEQEYDITINHSGYSTASEWYSRLQAGNDEIDVVAGTSDLVKEGMQDKFDFYEPLPVDIMESWEDTSEYSKGVCEEYFSKDGEIYGITMGRLLNPALNYSTSYWSDGAPESWGVLWDQELKGQVAMMDSGLYPGTTAACYTGQNPHSPSDFDEIEEALKQQKPLNKTYWSDYSQGQNMMASEEIVATGNTGGRAFQARFKLDGPVSWTVPKEGTSVGQSPLCIPKNAPNPLAGLLFYDWTMRSEERIKLFTEMGYVPEISDFDEQASNHDVPQEQIDYMNLEENSHPDATHYPGPEQTGEVRDKYNEIWTRVRAA